MALTHKQKEAETKKREKEAEEIVPLLRELLACPEVKDLVEDVRICDCRCDDGEWWDTLMLSKKGLVTICDNKPITDLTKCVMSFRDLSASDVRELIKQLKE